MEIEKGHTYPQFIKIIDSKVRIEKNNSEDYSCAWGIDKIVNFDLLCDKPLTKDMFVNHFGTEPRAYDKKYNGHREHFGEKFSNDFKKWQEAERKVIFKGFVEPEDGYFWNEEMDITIRMSDFMNLGDLFNTYKLELKNIEL